VIATSTKQTIVGREIPRKGKLLLGHCGDSDKQKAKDEKGFHGAPMIAAL
jgi:hypothetical protein